MLKKNSVLFIYYLLYFLTVLWWTPIVRVAQQYEHQLTKIKKKKTSREKIVVWASKLRVRVPELSVILFFFNLISLTIMLPDSRCDSLNHNCTLKIVRKPIQIPSDTIEKARIGNSEMASLTTVSWDYLLQLPIHYFVFFFDFLLTLCVCCVCAGRLSIIERQTRFIYYSPWMYTIVRHSFQFLFLCASLACLSFALFYCDCVQTHPAAIFVLLLQQVRVSRKYKDK